jgi:epoxyqueuosine reductase
MTSESDVRLHIIEKCKSLGASLAGIGSAASLRDAPSYEVCGKVVFHEEARSVLVLALAHEPSKPELDWWDDKPGGTPGNRELARIGEQLKQWLKQELGITARHLPYHLEKGGIFLKDAAVLAGLGVIGQNNLVITPKFGSRVRFRALFLDADLEPTMLADFGPCDSCDRPCRRACPKNAFQSGSYNRPLCDDRMEEDQAHKIVIEKSGNDDSPTICIKYCRACELACP